MAFNPFHSFQKHKKVIFAALTIVCMITFILSFGRGDPFERLAGLFGMSSKDKEKTVTTLYGKKVSEIDLGNLKFQRQMANDLILNGLSQGHEKMQQDYQKVSTRLSPLAKSHADLVFKEFQGLQTAAMFARFIQDPEMRRGQIERVAVDYLQKAPGLMRMCRSAATDHASDAEFFNKLEVMVAQNIWVAQSYLGAGGLYFGGSTLTDGLLDFMVWKHQADQLDINLNDNDLRAEINRQTLGQDILQGDSAKDVQRVGELLERAGYGRNSRITVDQVYQALRDEVRANMAQQAILGTQVGAMGELDRALGVSVIPAPATPDQMWNFYRDKRLTLQEVDLIPIPVKNYEAQVVGTPTDRELATLFREFKDAEPNPERDTPGFRQPRRVKIEWISARADSPHYQNLARERLLVQATSMVTTNVWSGAVLLNELAKLYAIERNTYRDHYRLPPVLIPEYGLPVYTFGHQNEAAGVASLIGLLTTMSGTDGSLSAAVAWQKLAVEHQHKKQAPALVEVAKERSQSVVAPTIALAGTLRSPIEAAAFLAGVYEADARKDQFMPLSVVSANMLGRMEKERAEEVLRENFDKILKEFDGWKNKEKEVPAELPKLIKQYGLTTGVSTKLADLFEIDDDPGLKPLKDAVTGPSATPAGRKHALGQRVFREPPGKYMPSQPMLAPGRGQEEKFLYWKVEETPAKTYDSYAAAPKEIQELVQKAWRTMKARDLARQAIEKVMVEARSRKNVDEMVRFLRDEGKKNGWDADFKLYGISRMVPGLSPLARGGQQYEPYKPPEDKINARSDFADELLKTLKKPGDITAIRNRPETVYYVVVLDRIEDEQSLQKKFLRDVYSKSLADNGLMQALEQELREKYFRGLFTQLRTDAGKVTAEGQWDIPEEVRTRLDSKGRGRGGEDE